MLGSLPELFEVNPPRLCLFVVWEGQAGQEGQAGPRYQDIPQYHRHPSKPFQLILSRENIYIYSL